MEGVRIKTGAALLWEEVVLTDSRGTATFHFFCGCLLCPGQKYLFTHPLPTPKHNSEITQMAN